jgi:hypothetical protein
MFWHRTFKLTGTLIGYGFGTVAAGFGATYLMTFGLEAMNINTRDNPVVPLAGVVAGTVVSVMGICKIKAYSTCSITEETLPIEHSEIIWKQESNTYNSGNQQITEYWDVLYTKLDLKGINGSFEVRGDYRNLSQAKMRFYRNDDKNRIFDWDFLGGF